MQKHTKTEKTRLCKDCLYSLRTYPGTRAVFRCAVDNKHITTVSKACQEFKENLNN